MQPAEFGSVAVVVSLYNPGPEIVERTVRWSQEIGPVCVVDDASTDASAAEILSELAGHGVTVMVNPHNSGIAHTLNVGVQRVTEDHHPQWILTMDQDSDIVGDHVGLASMTLASCTSPERVGMLCPRWIGESQLPVFRARSGELEVREPFQSGMLLNIRMIEDVGQFDESLFIDTVDTDYVGRARMKNWQAIPIDEGKISHQLGDMIESEPRKSRPFSSEKSRSLVYHAPFRTYYTTRNQIYLAANYWKHPRVISPLTYVIQASILASLARFSPDRRLQRKAIALGARDAFLRRRGRIGSGAARSLGLEPSPSGRAHPRNAGRHHMPHPSRVEILLSTWNGERYVAELLTSLLHQDTDAHLAIRVRDDGSSDRTVALVREFAEHDSRISLTEGPNVGVNESFHALMEQVSPTTDVVMFCDQDDVWCPDKVSAALRGLGSSVHGEEPALYCSRSMVTDSELKHVGPTRDYDSTSFAQAMVMNIAPGHTMALNRALLGEVRDHFDSDRIIIFDHWTYLVAAGLGRVVFDHDWYTLYRNHGGNEIGYEVRPARLRAVRDENFRNFTRQLEFFEEEFGNQLDDRRRDRLAGMVHQGSWLNRARYLNRFGIAHGPLVATLASSILFLVGRYRI